MLETKFALIGMEELIPGALWKGTAEQILQSIKQAEVDGLKPKVLEHDQSTKRWRLRLGDRDIQVKEITGYGPKVRSGVPDPPDSVLRGGVLSDRQRQLDSKLDDSHDGIIVIGTREVTATDLAALTGC